MTTAHEDRRSGMRDDRGARSPLALLLLGVLFVPAAIQLALDLSGAAETQAGILGAGTRTELEESIETDFWSSRLALHGYAPLASRVTGRGSSQVLRARDGWLFHRETLRYLQGDAHRDDAGDQEPARRTEIAITDFAEQLETREIELALVLAPTKATVHPEQLDRRLDSRAAPNWSGYPALVSRLRAAGIRVIDPTEALLDAKSEGAVYLRQDTHWSPRGARTAAGFVARELARYGLLDGLPGRNAVFDHRRVTVEARGDLAGLLPGGGSWLTDETLDLRQVVGTAGGTTPLGAQDSPVLLLGDSFSLAFSDARLGLGRGAGFAENLSEALGMPIDVIATPGGGATQVRRTLAARPRGTAGKRLIVWQIAQRDLLRARDGWQPVELPERRRPSGLPGVSAAGPFEVVVEALGHQLPDEIDYANCLAMLPYRLVNGTLPGAISPGDTLTVAVWGWRDFERQNALDARPGTLETLRVVPLGQRLSLESTCWMGELSGPPWWSLATD